MNDENKDAKERVANHEHILENRCCAPYGQKPENPCKAHDWQKNQKSLRTVPVWSKFDENMLLYLGADTPILKSAYIALKGVFGLSSTIPTRLRDMDIH